MIHSYSCRLVLIAVLLAFTGSGHAQFNGFVYEDKNGDGIPEGNEKGIPGALVSDGYEIVLTDRQGKFSLPKNPEARFITLTTPSGYEHTTAFYLKPDSADLTFGLRKAERTTGRFIQVTDMDIQDMVMVAITTIGPVIIMVTMMVIIPVEEVTIIQLLMHTTPIMAGEAIIPMAIEVRDLGIRPMGHVR